MPSPSHDDPLLNWRLTLESPSQSVASGNATPTWTTVRTVWGQFEGLGGTLLGTTAELSARFTIPRAGNTDVTPRWRIGLSGTNRKFALTAPPQDRDGTKWWLVIPAREVLS